MQENHSLHFVNWRKRLSTTLEKHGLAWLFLAITILLVYPAFLTTLEGINPWDESAYLHTGQILLDKGAWPTYANNPLMASFYAVLYMPFRNSPYWMAQVCSLGRVFLFIFLWLSVYPVARRLKPYAPPAIALGIFLAAPLGVNTLRFPSDPLFSSMAGLGLWQFLGYYLERAAHPQTASRHLAWASFFLGLSALARNDGLPLFVIFVGLTLIFGIKDRLLGFKEKPGWVNLAAAILPFAMLVGGYILIYGAFTGNFNPDTFKRTYDNFETGYGMVYTAEQTDRIDMYQIQEEARRVFGTPEENHYSVFNAIRRNPQAYLRRLQAFVKGLPLAVINAYGLRFSALLILLVIRGAYELLRQRRLGLLLIFALWPCHLASAFLITLVREGHLMFMYYLVFPLAAIGLWALLINLHRPIERWAWIIVLLLISFASLYTDKLAIFYGSTLMLGGLLSAYALKKLTPEAHHWSRQSLLVLLGFGLVLHGNYPSPYFPTQGSTAVDQAILYLQQHYPRGTRVGAASPGPTWAARMNYMGLAASDVPIGRNQEGFMEWLHGQEIRVIYVDKTLYNTNSRLWSLLEPQIGKGLERVFAGDEGDIQILVVKPRP